MVREKLTRLLAIADANTGGGSSNPPDDKDQDSSPEQQDEQQADKGGEQTPPETESEEPSTEDAVEETTKEEKETVEDKADEVAAILDKPEDEKLPFHKEPRFQELIKEKNTYKQEAESLKPLAQRAKVLDDYINQNGIMPEQLTNALEYLRCVNQEPEKAYQMLKPVYEKLALYAGDKLPDDLAAEVASGVLSEDRARQIARAQAQQQYQQMRGATAQQQQAMQYEQAIQGSINTWASAMMQRDPDFKPKVNGAVDGKWEYVDMKLRSMRQANPPKTTQEAVQQVEHAYTEAGKFFGAFQKPKTVKAGLRSSSSTQNSSAVVKSAEDVTRAILAGKRPHQLKYT